MTKILSRTSFIQSKTSLFLIAFTLFLFSFSSAANGKFGLGFVLGEPTAIDGKYWLSTNTAFDFGIGWGAGYGGYYGDCNNGQYYNDHSGYCNDRGYYYADRNGFRGLHVHMDYLMHNFNAISGSERFPIYYGPGINLNFWNNIGMQAGLRGVIGIAWMPHTAPVDIFFEIAPVLEVIPATYVDVNAGLGARFYF